MSCKIVCYCQQLVVFRLARMRITREASHISWHICLPL